MGAALMTRTGYIGRNGYLKASQMLMITIVDDSWNIERQYPTRVGGVSNIDVEDHAVILAYA
jgi:hypothetical protein